MKKYFLTSDIHSFFTPLKKALDEAGFDEKNKEHILVVLGDIFDRGKETKKVYDFLMSLPKERLVLIRGNHEDLFEKLTIKIRPQEHDFSNGTVRTFCEIADFPYEKVRDIIINWDDIKNKVLNSDVYKLISDRDRWVNYYIIKNKYVCVHSFVPEQYGTNWNKFDDSVFWYEARWGCPYELHEEYWDKIGGGKTLVCGHWHVSDFHKRYEGKRDDFSIYRGETLIALDACTAYTQKVNVLVL